MTTATINGKKERPALWYERDRWAYAKDREAIDELTDWVKQVDWKLFCTFTFAGRRSDENADHAFTQFMNRLERSVKSDVGYIRGDEMRFSGCGKPASGRHYHALFTSAAPLEPAFVESLWNTVAGNPIGEDGAKVEPYDAKKNEVHYVLKMVGQMHGDWKFGRLELFHPESRGLQTVRKRLRRHLQRHKARQQQFASPQTRTSPYKLCK